MKKRLQKHHVCTGFRASHSTKPGLTSSSSTPFTLIFTFSPDTTRDTSSSSLNSMSTLRWLNSEGSLKLTLLGIITKLCPFRHSPDSTLPITTVPISLYLSTMGIINGPSCFLFNVGKLSINGMKAPPSNHEQMDFSTGSLRFWPNCPEQGRKNRSLLKMKPSFLSLGGTFNEYKLSDTFKNRRHSAVEADSVAFIPEAVLSSSATSSQVPPAPVGLLSSVAAGGTGGGSSTSGGSDEDDDGIFGVLKPAAVRLAANPISKK
ncbi:hypothetical protein HUJ05_010369 [Dendroctonus ponderosae]|nr:hypothetical protein HUJ05_010369 [Dendroctonus ponderosae]